MTVVKETPPQENSRTENKPIGGESVKLHEVDDDHGRSAGFLSRNFVSRWRRVKEEWLEIDGYLVDSLRTEMPVRVKAGATFVGNIIAPKITVEGTVSGSVYGREIEVASNGQIWGDVLAISLHIASGGKVQGWVSSIDEADLERFRTSGITPDTVNLTSQTETTNEKMDTGFLARSQSQMESLHLVQMELAATMAARRELEQDFEKRLTEMAGEAYGKIHALTDQLTAVRSELAQQKRLLDEAQETLRQQKTQVERQTNELSVARELMTDQNQELGELRDLFNGLRQRHAILQAEKAEIDQALETTLKEKDALEARAASLETAHKGSLQYQVEQEDSLLRWQELAEITEKRAAELETQLQKAHYQLDESGNTLRLLREQRHELERELEKAQLELQEWQGNKTRPLVDAEALMEATGRITQLESDLADAEQEYLEQLIWYKASLGTTRSELELARETAASQAAETTRLQDELAQLQTRLAHQEEEKAALQNQAVTYQKEAAKWHTAVTDKESEWQKQTAEYQQTITLLNSDKKNMQTTLRESQMQLAATEAEVGRYLQETRTQGERLAEIHAQLVERELQFKQAIGQLKQARDMIEKQNNTLKQMKELAAEKIRTLQAENAQLRGRKP